ncbi:phage head protein [Elizabethkingia anophelis]|nr:phage head protein [Elizabethkingia anophelis]
MSKAPVFLTNDPHERNSYGFHVDTAGIDLKSRFEPNPVCLNNHSNDTKDVLGKWVDIEIKDGKLYMRPAFDTKTPEGEEVVRKVLAGTIKGCSLGIMFDPKDMVNENGKIILKKCVLFEVSIVAVPSNGNAIALFSMDGKQLSETEINTLCLSLQPSPKSKENHKTMKLLTTHLQLSENADETAILTAVKDIEAKLTTSKNDYALLKTKFEALETANKEKDKEVLNAELSAAVKDGRIDEAGKAPILELAHESAMKLLKSLPVRKPVKEQMKDVKDPLEKYAKLSWDEMDKGNMLAVLKLNHPDYYAERFEQEFNKKPAN